MKQARWNKWVMVVSLFACGFLHAEEEPVKESFLPTVAAHANWIFSGVVTNEGGESFGYFFQMQRDKESFHAVTALFDGQTKKVILEDNSYANLTEANNNNWKVGDSFLRFNPITESWVFGMKTHDKKGFNFKIDMMSQSESKPSIQHLRSGMELLIGQTGHLNGHIRDGENKEQFVTGKNAWFRQVWLSANHQPPHTLSGVFCRFDDGSGFYSVNMREEDAVRGAITGAFNAQGSSITISQFIKVASDKKGQWHIKISSPKLDAVLQDSVKLNSVISGYISQHEKLGFCMLSEDKLGEEYVKTEPSVG
jgi:hypothetical protein